MHKQGGGASWLNTNCQPNTNAGLIRIDRSIPRIEGGAAPPPFVHVWSCYMEFFPMEKFPEIFPFGSNRFKNFQITTLEKSKANFA
jgi:hypothetical protein